MKLVCTNTNPLYPPNFVGSLSAKTNKKIKARLFNTTQKHDIGKIGTPHHVLLKPGKLDQEEWQLMQKHVIMGAEILGEHDSPLLKMARLIALYHHEKFDGSGYPHRASGEAIPIEARIVAIADVFDALTSVRPYKKAWSVEEAVALLEAEKGKHFDPRLVDLFLSQLPDILLIKEQYKEQEPV